MSQFLWVIFPYLAIAIFIVGHIFRYRYDQFSWTAQSSEFIEKKRLKWGSLLFHLGIIPVFFGHVVGLLIPAAWTNAAGVSDELYHFMSAAVGGIFGFMTLAGMFILTWRRITFDSIRKLGSASDIMVNLMLLAIVFFGMYASFFGGPVSPAFDYRVTISPWVRGLFTFNPDPSLMANVPLTFQLHKIGRAHV